MSASSKHTPNLEKKKKKGKKTHAFVDGEEIETDPSVQEVSPMRKHKKSNERKSDHGRESNPFMNESGATGAEEDRGDTSSLVDEVSQSKKEKKLKKRKSHSADGAAVKESQHTSPVQSGIDGHLMEQDNVSGEISSTKKKSKTRKKSTGVVEDAGIGLQMNEEPVGIKPAEGQNGEEMLGREVQYETKSSKKKSKKQKYDTDGQDGTNSQATAGHITQKDAVDEHPTKQNTSAMSGQDDQSGLKTGKKKSKKRKSGAVADGEHESPVGENLSLKKQKVAGDEPTANSNKMELSGGREESLSKSSKKKLKKRKKHAAEINLAADNSSLEDMSPEEKQAATEANPTMDASPTKTPDSGVNVEKKKPKKKKQMKSQAPKLVPPTNSNKTLAIEYLRSWKKSQSPVGAQWRFQKVRQIWLLHNMLESDTVSSDDFATMLEYLKGLQGKARQLTVEKMEALIQELDSAMQELDEEGGAEGDSLKEMKSKWKRASSVLQTLA